MCSKELKDKDKDEDPGPRNGIWNQIIPTCTYVGENATKSPILH